MTARLTLFCFHNLRLCSNGKRINPVSLSLSPHEWLISPYSRWWKTHVRAACSLQVLHRCKPDHLVWILEGQPSSEVFNPFPLAPDCYLAFQWRLAAPPGGRECACQQEFMVGRWRMVGCAVPPLWENDSINSRPPPAPVVLLARWFLCHVKGNIIIFLLPGKPARRKTTT